jgi:hypothetical protein
VSLRPPQRLPYLDLDNLVRLMAYMEFVENILIVMVPIGIPLGDSVGGTGPTNAVWKGQGQAQGPQLVIPQLGL